MKTRSTLPVTWLVGRKTRLRPLEVEDVPLLKRVKLTIESQARGYVVTTLDGRDIGALGFLVNGPQAAISIAMRDNAWFTDGSAADALRVMCGGAMRSMPLVRIETLVPATHRQVVAAYRRAGFQREGLLREVMRVDGNYHDVVLMSMIRDA